MGCWEEREEKRNLLIHAHAWHSQNLYSCCARFAAKPGSLWVMTCGPWTASSSLLSKAYVAGRASCSLAICIHFFSEKTRLQGGLLLSTLQMLLCTDSTYSLCASPFSSFTGTAVGWIFGACFSWKKDQKEDCVTVNDLLLCLGATVLQDFALMVLSQERTNLTNFINSSLF